MFKRIMAPVDLAHADRLGKALAVTADLARQNGIPVTYVGVAAALPGPMGHNPDEVAAKLKAFAREQGKAHGIEAEAHSMVSTDPVTDLDDTLLKAVGETGADLVVMASHVPGLADHIWPSNGGAIAARAKVSVFVVRPE